MSAKTLSHFRSPVTLSQLKVVAGDKADSMAGELVIPLRARVIPTEWDDQQISDKATMAFRAQLKDWHWWGTRQDSREKILRLERRREARKSAIDRKTFTSTEA